MFHHKLIVVENLIFVMALQNKLKIIENNLIILKLRTVTSKVKDCILS